MPANYNSPGQIVISGTIEGVSMASEELKQTGRKRIVPLSVSGGISLAVHGAGTSGA
ncbi:MAG: hypothetical protein MZV63_54855 [Marinilabiliales bacterium]|nr:hypothetical protein [Marinilabiliales bacterium]